jgi:Cu/Zn superoxide dismutase
MIASGRRTWIIGLVTLATVVAACGNDSENDAEGEPAYDVELAEQNGSGQSGRVTLTRDGEQVRVVIELDGASDVAQPAHIHDGSCDTLGDVAYPLSDVVDGRSETTLNTTIEELQQGVTADAGLAVNVHASADDADTYVACGELPA